MDTPVCMFFRRGENRRLGWRCPACGETHSVSLDGIEWNGSSSRPTLSKPFAFSRKDESGKLHSCGGELRHGMLHFGAVCTHEHRNGILGLKPIYSADSAKLRKELEEGWD